MKTNPDKRTVLIEQWWIGCGLMIFWAIVIIGIFLGCARGAEVKLAWNANPENDIAGYILLYGTEAGLPTKTIETGNVTRLTVDGVEPGKTYYFSLIARNTSGQTSLPSDEIFYTVPLPPPPLPAKPTGLRITLQSSADNRAWDDRLVLYAQKEEGEFFRVKTELVNP